MTFKDNARLLHRSMHALYDCTVYPVLFSDDTCFLISGEISCAYGFQRDAVLQKKKMILAANVVTLFCSYAWFLGYTPYVDLRKICII